MVPDECAAAEKEEQTDSPSEERKGSKDSPGGEVRKSLSGRIVDKRKATAAEDGYEEHWPPFRKNVGKFLHSQQFDIGRFACIILNIVLLIVETDQEAEGNAPAWLTTANYLLIIFYALELSARLCIYRRSYFHSWANCFDMGIITADFLIESMLLVAENMEGFPSLVMFRVFRILRLGRTHKALVRVPELNIMVLGLGGALKTIFWGMILLAVVVMTFGILAVRLINPLNQEVAKTGVYDGCPRCPRAFESVAASALTFTQQIIAGDSWGQVSIPIIEKYPASCLFFFLVHSVVGMVVLNLILAVVIDSANKARDETDHQRAEIKEELFKQATAKLLLICDDLDLDKSGSLSLEELIGGYENDQGFKDAMTLLDISPRNMNTVFAIMDEDQSGEVRHDEFVDELYKMKSEDSHTMITFIKFYVQEIQREMRLELGNTRELLEDFHSSVKQVIANTSSLQANTSKLQVEKEISPKTKKDIAPEAPVAALNLDRFKTDQEDLKRLLQDMAKDVQRNTITLDQAFLAVEPPRSAVWANNLQDHERPLERGLAPVVKAVAAGSEDPMLALMALPPLPASNSSQVLRCCGASPSVARPPVSFV